MLSSEKFDTALAVAAGIIGTIAVAILFGAAIILMGQL